MFIRQVIIFSGFALGCLSCSFQQNEHEQLLEGNFLDASYQIQYLDTINHQAAIDSLLKAIVAEISIADSNSIIQQFNKAALDFELGIALEDTLSDQYSKGRHFLNCFLAANRFFELSDGIFDPTLKPVLDYWSHRAITDTIPITVSDSLMIDSLLQYVGLPYIALEGTTLMKDQSGIQMDFEVLIKGYAADQVGKWLTEKGIHNFLITIDAFAHAKGRNENGKFWKTNLKLPKENGDEEDLLATAQLPILSFAQAGDSQTVNPITGFPTANPLRGVTVFYEDCLTSAALANICMSMGYEQAVEFIAAVPGAEAYFVYSKENGALGIKKTEGLRTLLQLQGQ